MSPTPPQELEPRASLKPHEADEVPPSSLPPASSSPLPHRLSAGVLLPDAWSDPVNSLELGRSPSPSSLIHEARKPHSPQPTSVTEDWPGEPSATSNPSEESHQESINIPHDCENYILNSNTYDDADDVANISSISAPSHRPQDLSRILSGELQPTPAEVGRLQERRVELETKLEQERVEHELEQELDDATAAVGGSVGPSLYELMQQGQARPVAPGVVAIGAEQMDTILHETIVDADRLPESRENDGSPPTSDLCPSDRVSSELTPTVPVFESSPSFNNTSSVHKSPVVISTPGGRHIQFAQESSMQDTPFTQTLKYFKQYKGKENSPSKSRRNASLPEEIAELAKEAREEEEEAKPEELDKYREIDLAPLDPVLQDEAAGDLILFNASPQISGPQKLVDVGENVHKMAPTIVGVASEGELLNMEGTTFELDIPGSDEKVFKVLIKTNASMDCIADFIREQAQKLMAEDGTAEKTAKAFLTNPESYIVNKKQVDISIFTPAIVDADTDAIQKQLNLQPKHPACITIIGMIPAAMFYVTAAPIVHYAHQAVDMVLEKLIGLKIM